MASSNRNSEWTSASSNTVSDGVYFDVAPSSERRKTIILVFSVLVSLAAIICDIVQAKSQHAFYFTLLSLPTSILFTFSIHFLFKRRILLAEKLWLVNLSSIVLLIQAIVFIILVFGKTYSAPPTTTPMTTRPFTSIPFNTTASSNTTLSPNSTNATTTTVSTTKKYFDGRNENFLTVLYDLSKED